MKKLLTILLLCVLVFLKAHAQYTVPWTGGDDGPAIQSALNSNSYVQLQTGKIYQSSVFLTVRNNSTFELNDATLKPYSTLPVLNKPFISGQAATQTYSASASIVVTEGSDQFTYSGASSLHVGDLIKLVGPAYGQWGSAGAYYATGKDTITAVSGTTVTVSQPAPRSYTATQIIAYNPGHDIVIRNGHIDMRGRTVGSGVALYDAKHSRIEYMEVYADSNSSVGPSQGIVCTGAGNTIDHALVRNISPIHFGGSIYGINVGGAGNTISNCTVLNAATGISTGAQRDFLSTGTTITNSYVDQMQGDGQAVDFHSNSYNAVVDGGTLFGGLNTNGAGTVDARGNGITFRNLSITTRNPFGKYVNAVYLFEACETNTTIENCTFMAVGSGGGLNVLMNSSATQLSPMRNLLFRHNYVGGGMLTLKAILGANITIDSNRFETTSGYSAGVNFSTATAFAGYDVHDNTFINRLGNTYNYSVQTPTATVTRGLVYRDTVYVMNSANLLVQFRIQNTLDSVYDNVLYAPANYFIKDLSGTTSNYYHNNVWINGVGTPTVFNPGTSTGTTDPWSSDPPPVDPPPLSDCANCVYWHQKQQP